MGVRIHSSLLIGVLFISVSPANSDSVSSVTCTDGGNECQNIEHSECDTTQSVLKCKCKAGYAEDATGGNTCVLDSVSEVLCTTGGNECQNIAHSACDTTTLKCQCEAGYKVGATDNSICVKAPVSEVVCTEEGDECKDIAHSTCDTSPNELKCKCKVGYKVGATDDSICVKAPVSEVVCTDGGEECKDIAHSECDTTTGVFKCKCEAGYKEDATNESICVKVLGSQCSGSNACPGLPNSVCVSDKCVCASDYGEKNNLCILTVSGTVCTDTGVECAKIDNAICDAEGGKCKCSPGSTMNIDTCVPENAATTRHKEATILAISVLVAIKVFFW